MIEANDTEVSLTVENILNGSPEIKVIAKRLNAELDGLADVDEEAKAFNLAVIERLLIALGV